MKAVVTIVELAIVALILLATFALFFPRFTYVSGWSDALLLLKGRDVLLAADRISKLYEYSFDFIALSNFLNKLFPEEALIYLPSTYGTIKSKLHVACNCTAAEKETIVNWLEGQKGKAGLRLNGRDISFDVCTTHLEELNPCLSKDADLLIIWGRKSLNNKHKDLLKGHVGRGNGIVEVRDFLGPMDIDVVQREIFGLSWVGPGELPRYDEFSRKPEDAGDTIYIPWKHFYHLPINLEYRDSEAIAGCNYKPSAKGYFTFNKTSYTFWICSPSSIYLDFNRNNVPDSDEVVNVGEDFIVAQYNFSLRYIKDNVSIGISFKPDYRFNDFLRTDSSSYNVQPSDGNRNRILLVAKPQNLPVAILNVTPISRVAWIANFTEDGVGDDERLLFISLLLWASNKMQRAIGGTEVILYPTSYINVKNEDMFEVYEFRLSIGYPYK